MFESAENELFLLTERAARNMAFQGTFASERGVINKVADIIGADLIGTKVRPPMGIADAVYVLPMEGVLATKVSVLAPFGVIVANGPTGNRSCHLRPI